jgi:predicted metal-binding protein
MRSVIFCTTCRHSPDSREGPDRLSGGETLARCFESLLQERGRDDVVVERHPCLWACTRHCNVWIRDERRFSYLAGGFEPARASAEAILAWFDLHGRTEDGLVPFRDWPQGMRGHFIARLPPARARGS